MKESFTILYSLVFELRQGMEDLQFRLQITDGKISTLLQILSSLQDAFPPDLERAASAEEPHAEYSEGNVQTQRFADIIVEQTEQEDTDMEEATRQHVLQPTLPILVPLAWFFEGPLYIKPLTYKQKNNSSHYNFELR